MDYFDEPPDQNWIQINFELANNAGFEVSERWHKKQSKDFYLGMIAHHRLVLSIIPKLPLPDHIKNSLNDEFTKIGIEAALCAAQKDLT